MIPLLAAVTADASDAPVVAPLPVEEWAQRDVRAMRLARVGLVLGATGPVVAALGDTAATSFFGTGDPAYYAGLGLIALGTLQGLTGPGLLFYGSARSAGALRRQGLAVRSTWASVAAPVWLGALVTGFVIGGAAADEPAPEAFAPVIAGYIGSLSLGAIQLNTNHLARRDAGWLGLTPTDRGVAVVGTF